MKKISLLFVSLFFCIVTEAQETVIKTSATDATFGRYEVSYERMINEGMNNIKSSGRLKKQGKWPNIMTKHSLMLTIGHVNENIKQSFGKNLTFTVDTNTFSDHDGDPSNGTQVVYDAVGYDPALMNYNEATPEHSLQRDVVIKTKGFYFAAEYRSYIKTYKQRIGDPPRGWYFAPFAEVKFQTVDFNDETPLEMNNAMAILLDDQRDPIYYGDEVSGFYDYTPDNPNFIAGPEGQTVEFYNYLTSLGIIDWNGDGLIEMVEQPNPDAARSLLRSSAGWKDVSHKYDEFAMTGGIVIGRQWLFWDKLALDVQIGPQYKYITRSERLFNGNDSWNVGNATGQAGDQNDFINKYWDVYNPTNETIDEYWDPDRLANYHGIRDYDGDLIEIRQKGDANESQLRYNTGFNGDHFGLTDFTKLYTYRIKVKIGYAF